MIKRISVTVRIDEDGTVKFSTPSDDLVVNRDQPGYYRCVGQWLADLVGASVLEASSDDEPVTPEVLRDMLLLVETNIPNLAVIQGWPQEQQEQVADWAARVYLYASDNDEVDVPPKPEILVRAQRK